LFYSTNALHVCTAEPCNNGTFPPGNQKGPALGFGGSIPGTTGKITTGKVTTKAAPVTTGKLTTGKITTGAASVTTGKITTSKVTTGAASVTTGKITTGRVSTTGSNVQPITTSKSTTSKSSTTKSTITSGKLTTGIQGVDPSTTSFTQMCYLPGTPNLNGRINSNPPTCGKSRSKGRCVDGQCCSQYGYCGPFADSNGKYYEDMNGVYQEVTQQYAFSMYCNNRSIADYRKVPCDTLTSFSNQHGDKLTSFATSMNINFSEFFLVLFCTCVTLYLLLWWKFLFLCT